MLLSGVKLLFEELNFALQTIHSSLAALSILRQRLRFLDLALCLLQLRLLQGETMLQRRNLLLLLKQELIKLLVLSFGLFSASKSIVGLGTQRRETLASSSKHNWSRHQYG